MSKQLMRPRTTLAVLALAGMALFYADSAKAGGWCAHLTDATTNCGFATLQQCKADISGIGGICSPNPQAK